MFLDLKKKIFARYLLSVCQCVIEDLDLDFYYFHGSVVRNNYFDLKNTCFCKSKRLHGFGEYYCEKNEELLILSITHFTPVDSLAKFVYIVMDCFVIAASTIISLFIYMILSKFVYLLYISEIKVGIEGIEILA